jgi:glutathione S-transferase
MKLYYSTLSPYARKVRVLIIERGLEDQVELIEVLTTDLQGPLPKSNPLAKVPTLVTENDGIVHDSPVIGEYLDGYIKTASSPGKAADLRDKCLVATADGIMDAGYAARMEKVRPENLQWQDWKDKQFGKIDRTLDQLEHQAHELPTEPTLGAIALGCALQWIEFRHPEGQWLMNRPALAAWLHAFAKRASIMATAPTE